MLKKIASNTISLIFSKAGTAIISIFLISILTNYLTVEMYGMYSKIYNYVGIFVFLADLGLYTITIREITNDKKNTDKIIGNVMSLRLILGIIILFLSVFIAYFLPGYDNNLALISIGIVSVYTIFQLLNSSVMSLMQANLKVEFSLFATIFGKLINVGLIALIVFILYNKESLLNFDIPFILIMVAGLIGIIVTTIINWVYAKRIGNISFRFDLDYIKHLFKISLPYGIALFLSIIYFKVDIILLSLLEPGKTGDLSIALYSLPMKIVEVIMIVGGFYMNSMLPSLTNGFKNKDNKEVSKLTNISLKVMIAFSSFTLVMGVIFRDYIIEIIANRNYIETSHLYNSSDAFLIVFAVIVFHFISLVFIYLLISSNNQSKLLGINAIVTVFNIVGNIILIPKYSFIGAGIVTLFSQVLLMLLGYIYTKNKFSLNLNIGFIFRGILAGIGILFLGNYLVNNLSVGLYFDFFIYGGLLFLIYGSYYFLEFKKIKRSF